MESPTDLHKQSGYDRQTYSVARCVMSEIGDTHSAYHLVPIAELIRNRSKRLGIEPYQLLVQLTSPAYAFTQWQYGEGAGRYASTRQDPSTKTIAVAKLALNQGSAFVPPNSEQWDEPSLQDKTPSHDAIAVAQSWGADGYEWIGPLPGVISYDYAIFAFVGKKVDNAALIAMIRLARAKGKAATVGTDSPDPATAAVARTGVPWWLLVAGGATFMVLR